MFAYGVVSLVVKLHVNTMLAYTDLHTTLSNTHDQSHAFLLIWCHNEYTTTKQLDSCY